MKNFKAILTTLFFLLLEFIATNQSVQNNSLTLWAHKWCKNSVMAVQIFEKLEQNYPNKEISIYKKIISE